MRRLLLLVHLVLIPAAGSAADAVFDFYQATCEGDGIRVEWRTLDEPDTIGFQVDRGETAPGPFVQIGLVESRGPGFLYSFLDRGAPVGILYHYRIRELNASGSGAVTPAFPVQEPLPADQANVLRAVRSGADVVIDFAFAPGPPGWMVYRDGGKRALGVTPVLPAPARILSPQHLDTGAIGRRPDDYYRLKALAPCSLTPGP